MTGKKITLSAAMRARDVSRPPEDADAGPAGRDERAEPGDAEPGSAPFGEMHPRRSELTGGENESFGENRSLRPGEPRGAASGSERAQARFGQTRGAPEAKREGSRAAQPEDTAGTGAGVGGSKGGEAPLGSGVRGIQAGPEALYSPGRNRRTRNRKRRAD
jgi:hypothetical protein